MRDRFVLLTRRKDLNDFDNQIKLQVWTDRFPLFGQANLWSYFSTLTKAMEEGSF